MALFRDISEGGKKMKNFYKGALAVFLVATVFFAGCVGQSKPEAKAPMVIIRATMGEPESFDPAFDYETAGGEIIENTYERLVWYDGAAIDKFIPWLAES
jgi:peptide/nickel transport system substrate-binding protein